MILTYITILPPHTYTPVQGRKMDVLEYMIQLISKDEPSEEDEVKEKENVTVVDGNHKKKDEKEEEVGFYPHLTMRC